jgi:glutathione peroxidase
MLPRFIRRWRQETRAARDAERALSEHSPATARWWRFVAAAAAVGAIAFGAVSILDFSIDRIAGDVLGPAALVAEPTTDDASGDAQDAAAEADRYLPVPSALEDERVVAAIGPIANLACRRSDYEKQSHERPVGPPSDLGPPLTEADTQTAWLDQGAAATALAPITDVPEAPDTRDAPDDTVATTQGERVLAAPIAPSESEVDHLYTDHLFAAAMSPLAALHATPSDAPAAPASAPVVAVAPSADCPALLRYTFNRLQTGEAQTLCQFQGKVLLIVNTASYCGYTKQYHGLEAMYRKYKNRGLVVVGFPSNDFGGQEPGTNGEIAEFCRTTYGVEFPMFEKSSVAKLNANPLYTELAAKTGAAPRWNFHKYVVDRSGTHITSFPSDVTPDARSLVDLIEHLLAEKPAASNG